MWAYQCTAICQTFLGVISLQLKLVDFSEGYQMNKKIGGFQSHFKYFGWMYARVEEEDYLTFDLFQGFVDRCWI